MAENDNRIVGERLRQVEAMALQERNAGNTKLADGWDCRAAGIKDAIAILERNQERPTRPEISAAEADRLYEEAPADPISDSEVDRLVAAATKEHTELSKAVKRSGYRAVRFGDELRIIPTGECRTEAIAAALLAARGVMAEKYNAKEIALIDEAIKHLHPSTLHLQEIR